MNEFSFDSIPVLFEDDNVIVLNKPQGLLAIEDGYQPELPNLRSLLKDRYGQIWTVHRLDKDTSGVIIFAKNSESHKFLNAQFSSRLVKKEYHAVAQGFPPWVEKTISYPLKTNGDRKHRTVIDLQNGKLAKTLLRVIGKNDFQSYLDIFPATGYTHQIRAHCAGIGLPILGDRLYFRGCDFGNSFETDHLFLHAYAIKVSLKPNEELQQFMATLPQYFIDVRKLIFALP